MIRDWAFNAKPNNFLLFDRPPQGYLVNHFANCMYNIGGCSLSVLVSRCVFHILDWAFVVLFVCFLQGG